MNPDTTSEQAAASIVSDIIAGRRTIGDILGPIHGGSNTIGLNPDIKVPRGDTKEACVAPPADVSPMDESNKKLVSSCGPKDRVNPTPQEYDLVVVGAGVAGLLSSIMSKALGKKVLLIEKHYMGGDCLNVGCFPSKALISCARRAHEAANSSALGVNVTGVSVDFPFVMERMRKLRSQIASTHDSVERYCRDFCTDIMLGSAVFTSKTSLEVTGHDGKSQTVNFSKAMIATGGSASIPPIPGLREAPHITNMTLFNLEELPSSIVLIGAGPIGIEMAQTMARFGSKVTILEIAPQLLPREDEDAAMVLQKKLSEEKNLTILVGISIVNITYNGNGKSANDARMKAPWDEYTVSIKTSSGESQLIRTSALLNATGRAPNVSGLGLELAGVQYDTRSGVHIDEFFQTSNPSIYSCGDVASPFKFTHAADWQARTAIRNMFLGLRESHDNLLTPWCTYTDPEIAHVGKYEKELKTSGVAFETYKRELKDVDRCLCEGVEEGFVKITCSEGTDRILGATIVGPNAGDLISQITLCMTNGIGLSKIAGTMYPYPTTAEAIRQCAAQYWQRGKLKTTVNKEVVEQLLKRRKSSL